MRSGIKLLSDNAGTGAKAFRGDTVTVRYDLTLNYGDIVHSQQTVTFIVGQREVVAGLEYGTEGMRVGGRRTIRVSPHLCYRDVGVPDVIPPDAALVFAVELLAVERKPPGLA